MVRSHVTVLAVCSSAICMVLTSAALGDFVVSGWSADDPILRFDSNSGARMSDFASGGNAAAIRGMKLGPDGIVYVNRWGVGVEAYGASDGTPHGIIASVLPAGANDGPFYRGLTVGPNGYLFVSHHYDGKIGRYDRLTGEPAGPPSWPFDPRFTGSQAQIPAELDVGHDGLLYVFSDNDHPIYMGGWENSSVQRYNPATGEYVDTIVYPGPGSPRHAWFLRISPNGDLYVATKTPDGSYGPLRRYDTETGAYLGDLVIPGENGVVAPGDFDFGSDGLLYVLAILDDDSNAILQYQPTGEYMGVFAAVSSAGDTFTPLNLVYIPEPTTMGLMTLGMLLTLRRSRRGWVAARTGRER